MIFLDNQTSWHRRNNSWQNSNQGQMYPMPPRFAPHQQPVWPPMPQAGPMMPQYQMPHYPYIPNSPYAFGYQNWPQTHGPFFGPPPPPPLPPSEQRMQRFPGARHPRLNPRCAPPLPPRPPNNKQG